MARCINVMLEHFKVLAAHCLPSLHVVHCYQLHMQHSTCSHLRKELAHKKHGRPGQQARRRSSHVSNARRASCVGDFLSLPVCLDDVRIRACPTVQHGIIAVQPTTSLMLKENFKEAVDFEQGSSNAICIQHHVEGGSAGCLLHNPPFAL